MADAKAKEVKKAVLLLRDTGLVLHIRDENDERIEYHLDHGQYQTFVASVVGVMQEISKPSKS